MRYLHAKMAIPEEWTGEQALAVVDLLDTISTAIWGLYEQRIVDAMHRRDDLDQATRDPPEDMPF